MLYNLAIEYCFCISTHQDLPQQRLTRNDLEMLQKCFIVTTTYQKVITLDFLQCPASPLNIVSAYRRIKIEVQCRSFSRNSDSLETVQKWLKQSLCGSRLPERLPHQIFSNVSTSPMNTTVSAHRRTKNQDRCRNTSFPTTTTTHQKCIRISTVALPLITGGYYSTRLSLQCSTLAPFVFTVCTLSHQSS